MKRLLISSLLAVLMLASCQNESKKNDTGSTGKDSSSTPSPAEPPAPPVPDSIRIDSNAKAATKDNNSEVFNFQSMTDPPTYPGGMNNFYKTIAASLTYPKEAAENNIQGSVLMSFIVEKDGSLSEIKVTRKLGYGLDEVAIKALKMSKKWTPGIVDGKPVRVKFNIPVKFALDKA